MRKSLSPAALLWSLAVCALVASLWLLQCRSTTPPSAPRPSSRSNQTRTTSSLQAAPARRSPLPRRVALSQKFAENQTFAFALPQLPAVAGVGPPRAANCKVCHSAHAREWSQSTHAAALRDLQYQVEIAKASSPRWLCLNCHIPVQNQRKTVVTGLQDGDVRKPIRKPNPGYDPAMRKEGVTCASCHVRLDAKGNSVIIGAIGSKLAPHPVKRDRRHLRRSCLRCHDPQGERITPHLVCWFQTRKELANGPLGGKKDCVDCHMPTTQRRLVPAWKHLPQRTSHQHHWVGGGVPKDFSGYPTLAKRGYHSGLTVTLTGVSPSKPSQPLALTLLLHNQHAGHWLPTADPERYLWGVAKVRDATGKVTHRVTLRIGQTWKWEPRAEKVGDNRLKPNETRPWKLRLPLPSSRKGATVELRVYHVRLSSKTARYMVRHAPNNPRIPPAVRKKVARLGAHYPLATLLYREDINLTTGQRKRYSRKALLQESAREQHKPLDQRDY